MASMKIDPQPPVHLLQKIFHPLDLGRPILIPPPTLFNKLWNNNRTVHVNKRNQNKSKTKLRPRVLLFDLAHN